ncbi:hypothetical protein EJ04DRAFT_304518 [Polyplosphaeria fusca]|uniref:Uncharacterized protein n=1 Tax=Polyplosphaeria fusca TaxID=682080 RepID=A0A9P4UZS1_9PLEO|nr:hypothetical protein EJ04DRAFT_304518 [Polyplosphaeria fusca]
MHRRSYRPAAKSKLPYVHMWVHNVWMCGWVMVGEALALTSSGCGAEWARQKEAQNGAQNGALSRPIGSREREGVYEGVWGWLCEQMVMRAGAWGEGSVAGYIMYDGWE